MTNRTKRLRKKKFQEFNNWREKFDGYIKRGIRYVVKKRKGSIKPPSQTQMNTD